MTAHELFARLRMLGVRISLEGTRVRVSAPPGVLSENLWHQLETHRAEIHDLLSRIRKGQGLITRAERGERIPLSYAQQRLWFLAQMEGVSEAYHIPFGLRLKGKLDQGALRQALDRIVMRHEALRTTFITVDGEAVQRIIPVEESRFHLIEH